MISEDEFVGAWMAAYLATAHAIYGPGWSGVADMAMVGRLAEGAWERYASWIRDRGSAAQPGDAGSGAGIGEA
jgi:hypothetical protein